MKENIFDVLMYLFEHYMDEVTEYHSDQESLSVELVQAGFPKGEVNKAFSWLEGLSAIREHSGPLLRPPSAGSMRHFTSLELNKINQECQGFLLFLERNGVIDPGLREVIIDRAMALESDEMSLEQLKWVTLMVLVNQPGDDKVYSQLENLIFDELHGHLQ
jgi:Smg protein